MHNVYTTEHMNGVWWRMQIPSCVLTLSSLCCLETESRQKIFISD
jgi:hypothetical protein